jgi:hypothetical protein
MSSWLVPADQGSRSYRQDDQHLLNFLRNSEHLQFMECTLLLQKSGDLSPLSKNRVGVCSMKTWRRQCTFSSPLTLRNFVYKLRHCWSLVNTPTFRSLPTPLKPPPPPSFSKLIPAQGQPSVKMGGSWGGDTYSVLL